MPDVRQLCGLYEGTVADRDDPEGLGRVKITVPGLIEEPSPMWVWPMCSPGGGTAQRGHFEPPAVGANIGVLFVQGDIHHPRYFSGPWGIPEGVSDIPTGALVEAGVNRQNAVTEDEEWTVQRDSRSTSKRYLIKHKSSSQAILLDADNDKVHLVRDNSDQALVRGTEYRQAEVNYLGALHTALSTFASALSVAADIAAVNAAGTALKAALTGITETDIRSTPSAYLSTKSFTD